MRSGRSALVVGALFLISGCSSAPECSSDNVIATVKQLATQALARDGQLKYVFDAEKSKYEVTAIRTVNSTKTSCSCKASLHILLELKDELKRIRDTKPDTYASMLSNNFREAQIKDLSLDITYQAEQTDDKKDVYVTVQGL